MRSVHHAREDFTFVDGVVGGDIVSTPLTTAGRSRQGCGGEKIHRSRRGASRGESGGVLPRRDRSSAPLSRQAHSGEYGENQPG
jgi:hypothetical protein